MEFASRIKRMDVMLLDPDKVSRGNLGALVRDFGCYSVRPFDRLEDAVISCITKPPSVLLCNWDLGAQSPADLMEQIRCHPSDAVAKTPVIFVSKSADRTLLSQCLVLGATQVIVSPVVPADLMSKLVFVLKDQRATLRRGNRMEYVTPPKRPMVRKQPDVKIVEFPTAKPSPASASNTAAPTTDPDDILEL